MENKLVITLIVVLAGGVGVLNGCNVIQDGLARLMGAPTSSDIAAEEERLREAEEALVELEKRKSEAEAQALEAQRIEDAEKERTDAIKSLYGQMAQRYTDLSGAAQDAMMRAMEDLRAQLDASEVEAQRAAQLVAGYIASVKTIEAEVDANNAIIDDAFAQLQGFDDATAAAIDRVGGFVRTVGKSAGLLGVPGASAGADLGGNIIEGLLTSALLGTGAGVALRQRQRRRREETGRKVAEEEANNLTRIVKATAKFRLITDDVELRAGAREFAGEAAHRALKIALTKPIEASMEATT